MNSKELYVLNRALDGEDIPFIPSFKTLGISGIMIDAIKEGMIKKGLLMNCNEFTEEGIKAVDRLRRYKEAKKHMKLNNLSMGIISQTQSILIEWNPLFEEYAILVIDSTMGAEQIAENYHFLTEELQTEGGLPETLTYPEFTERFELNPKTNFRLKIQSGDFASDEIYLKADGKRYRYDCAAQILHAESGEEMRNILNERMGV